MDRKGDVVYLIIQRGIVPLLKTLFLFVSYFLIFHNNLFNYFHICFHYLLLSNDVIWKAMSNETEFSLP